MWIDFWGTSKNIFFIEQLWTTASKILKIIIATHENRIIVVHLIIDRFFLFFLFRIYILFTVNI